MDEESEIFVMHIATLEAPLSRMTIHSLQKARITTLKQNEASIEVSTKYFNFADIFCKEKALVLPEQTDLNKHAIELENSKQLLYEPIYNLGPMELETLKIYIKTHLKTGFIQSPRSPTGTLILFDKKPDGSLQLYVNYRELNNLTIKN